MEIVGDLCLNDGERGEGGEILTRLGMLIVAHGVAEEADAAPLLGRIGPQTVLLHRARC